jgi:RNA polymerase sigma factor (sigma-70 family)
MAVGELSKVIRRLHTALEKQDLAGTLDAELLSRYVERRDETAFEALVRRHGPMVFGVCRRVLHNSHDAEDALQATFLILVRKAPAIESPGMIGNWLYGVAYRTALHARDAAAKRRAKEAEMVHRTVKSDGTWAELRLVLDQELERLPEKYRVVLVLCDLEGKNRRETARQLGLPEGTVASRLATARKLLAKRLAHHGFAFSGGVLAAMLTKNAAACLPPSVLTSTIKSASLLAAGQSVAGVISSNVTTMADGGLKTMLLMKLKSLIMLLATVTALTTGLGAFTYYGFAQQAVNRNATEARQLAAEVPASGAARSPDDHQSVHYCWLGFGPKAKIRALVRLKGEEVAIDRDGDRKFDRPGERFESENDCKNVVIADPDGSTSYVITSVHVLHVVPPQKYLAVRVHVRGAVSYPQCCIVQLANQANGAPLAHFHGPLKISTDGWRIVNRATRLFENSLVNVDGLLPQSLKDLAGKELATESTLPKSLNRSGEPASLYAGIATDGDGTHVAICSPSDDPEKRRETAPFPKGIQPVVDVEFPAKNPGSPTIKKRYLLDQFCCDGLYRGPVRVPDDAGAGTAKVTFSFDAWKEGRVAPTTVEIPLDDEPANGERDKGPTPHPEKDGTTTRSADKQSPAIPREVNAESEKERRRMLRWRINFDTKDGREYAKQLEALGARLALPTAEPQRYRFVCDLSKRPKTTTLEDISTTNHIFLIESNRNSVELLSKELGLKKTPEFIVVFLPRFVEDELRRKELDFAHRPEKEIMETVFRFSRSNRGYEIAVTSQR